MAGELRRHDHYGSALWVDMRHCIGTGHAAAYRKCCRDCLRWRTEKAAGLRVLRVKKRFVKAEIEYHDANQQMPQEIRNLWLECIEVTWHLNLQRLRQVVEAD